MIESTDGPTGRQPADATAPDSWLGNARSLVLGRLVVAALGWTGTIIVARNLDADQFGRFTFVFGLLGMMTIVTDLGLGRVALAGVMPGAEDPRRFAGSYVVLRSLLGLVGYAAAVLFTFVVGYSSEIVIATAIAGAVIVLATTSHAYEIVLQAQLRMGIVAGAAIVGRSSQLALTAVVVVADGGLIPFLLPAIAAEILIAAVKIPQALRLQAMTYSIRLDLWRRMLREAVPISIGAALATLYFRVDSIMLSKMADFTAVAIYGIAFKFVDVLHFISLSVSAPLLSVLVAAWPSRPDDFRRTIDLMIGLLVLAIGGLVVGFALFATDAIELLYGSAYLGTDGSAGRVLQLLVVGQIIAFGSVLGLTILIATARHGRYPYLALAGLVVNVGLNFWTIPRWGIEGAAVTTIATNVVVFVGMVLLVRGIPDIGPVCLAPLLRVVPAALVGIGVGLLVDRVTHWAMAAVAAQAVYLAAALPLRVIGPASSIGRVAETPSEGLTPGRPGGSSGSSGSVVLVGHSRSGSGAELVALRYAGHLLASGRAVGAVCPEGFLAERLRALGFDPIIIPDLQLPAGSRPVAAVAMIGRWLRAAWIVNRRTDRVDVLVVNGLLALPAVALGGRSRSALWLVHDVVVRSDLRLVARLSTRRLAVAAAVSSAAAALPTALGVPTSLIRNGTAWPVEPAHRSSEGRPVIGINAKVTPWKGHRILLEAVAALPGVELEILGGSFPKDDAYLSELRARAARPDLAGRVRFLGHRDEPLKAMAHWSVAVSASVDPEAGPLSVLEAMSLGIPVVATNHGGAVEVLGSAGLLVEPADVEAMTEAIGRLLADPELRDRCSAAGRASVADGLTEQAANDRFLALVNDLRAGATGR
ncbi:MAG: glycosyltransferase [Acidimicrobiales bacterium]